MCIGLLRDPSDARGFWPPFCPDPDFAFARASRRFRRIRKQVRIRVWPASNILDGSPDKRANKTDHGCEKGNNTRAGCTLGKKVDTQGLCRQSQNQTDPLTPFLQLHPRLEEESWFQCESDRHCEAPDPACVPPMPTGVRPYRESDPRHRARFHHIPGDAAVLEGVPPDSKSGPASLAPGDGVGRNRRIPVPGLVLLARVVFRSRSSGDSGRFMFRQRLFFTTHVQRHGFPDVVTHGSPDILQRSCLLP